MPESMVLNAGKYDLLINLQDEDDFYGVRNIELPVKKEREIEPGWFKLGEIAVK